MIAHITDDFDLAAIASSGQCFRWELIYDDQWRIVHREHCLYIKELSGRDFELDCDEDEFHRVWYDYFDLTTDYRKIREMIDPGTDPFLDTAASYGRGIRILRQDPWETAVSFLISQNRNIPAIIRSVDCLCRAAGEAKTDRRGERYYSFPTPEAILALPPTELSKCGLGYRDKYVLAIAKAAADGSFCPARISQMADGAAIAELMKLYGVGRKVASCIALFGFHRTDVFPVDTWIRRVLENEYPSGYPAEKYRPYNGVFQQYMFAFYRHASRRS